MSINWRGKRMNRLDFGKPTQEKQQPFAHIP